MVVVRSGLRTDVLLRPSEVLPPTMRCKWQDKTTLASVGHLVHPLLLGGFWAFARLRLATNKMWWNRTLVARMARDGANWGLPTISTSSQHGTHGYAPIPSTDNTVVIGLASVAALIAWPTQSTPARAMERKLLPLRCWTDVPMSWPPIAWTPSRLQCRCMEMQQTLLVFQQDAQHLVGTPAWSWWTSGWGTAHTIGELFFRLNFNSPSGTNSRTSVGISFLLSGVSSFAIPARCPRCGVPMMLLSTLDVPLTNKSEEFPCKGLRLSHALAEPTSQEMRACFQHGHSQRKHVLQIELVQLVPLVFRLKRRSHLRLAGSTSFCGGWFAAPSGHMQRDPHIHRLHQHNPRIYSARWNQEMFLGSRGCGSLVVHLGNLPLLNQIVRSSCSLMLKLNGIQRPRLLSNWNRRMSMALWFFSTSAHSNPTRWQILHSLLLPTSMERWGGDHLCCRTALGNGASKKTPTRPANSSANFDFGQFRLRPISTSANFDFRQFRLQAISTSSNSTSGNFDFRQFRLQAISTSGNFDFRQFRLQAISTSARWPKSNCPKPSILAAPGPLGMTVEHLRPLLDNPRDVHALFLMAGQLAQQKQPSVHFVWASLPWGSPQEEWGALLLETLFEDLCHAQSLSSSMMLSRMQHHFSKHCPHGQDECIAHALQALCEQDPNATILSVDGIGAFHLVSRGAMLQGLHNVSPASVPFVRQFYGTPSRYLWEDDEGVIGNPASVEEGWTHFCVFGWHLHEALPWQSGNKSFGAMRASGCMMAKHKCGTGLVCAQQDATCWTEPLVPWIPISPRFGEGRGCLFQNRASKSSGHLATIWCAQSRSTQSCWIGSRRSLTCRVLGRCCSTVPMRGRTTLCKWHSLQKLMTRASGGACVQFWGSPQTHNEFASEHGRCWIAKCSENMCSSVLGKLADSLAMIRERHPGVANMIVDVLATGRVTPTLNALAQSDFAVRGVQGFDPPSWQALSHGARPPQREPDEREPGTTKRGWQHEAASPVDVAVRSQRKRLDAASCGASLEDALGGDSGLRGGPCPSHLHFSNRDPVEVLTVWHLSCLTCCQIFATRGWANFAHFSHCVRQVLVLLTHWIDTQKSIWTKLWSRRRIHGKAWSLFELF